jgi:hypothetical protein
MCRLDIVGKKYIINKWNANLEYNTDIWIDNNAPERMKENRATTRNILIKNQNTYVLWYAQKKGTYTSIRPDT